MGQMEFLDIQFLENSVKSYLIFGSILLLGLVFKSLISSYLKRLFIKSLVTNPMKMENQNSIIYLKGL